MSALGHRFLIARDLALINPLQVEAGSWSDLPTVPLVPAQVQGRQQLMPRLLDLRRLTDAMRIELLERSLRQQRISRHPYFSALLNSKAGAREVCMHLARQLVVTTPGQSRALLRFYDPRVFEHLRWLLTGPQLDVLLGPIETWSWHELDGQWRTHQRAEDPSSQRLRLHPGQWDTLARLDLLNKTLRAIERHDPALMCDETVPERADALLGIAYRDHGLVEPDDRCLFAVQATVFDPAIHRHPELAKRLVRSRDGTSSYVAACGDLDDSTLRRFVIEIAPPSRMLA